MSSNSDIPKNDIFYNIIEELGEGWYISAQKLFSKVHFRDAEGGGCILSPNFQMVLAQKFHAENVMLLHW